MDLMGEGRGGEREGGREGGGGEYITSKHNGIGRLLIEFYSCHN